LRNDKLSDGNPLILLETKGFGIFMDSPFWQKYVYQNVFFGCGLFVLLTVAAMFTYPGGLFTGELTTNYDFFRNFFSDLGRITVAGQRSNIVSAILFFLALSIAGIGLIFFFIAFRDFFKTDRTGNMLSLFGTITGVASGLCFVSIACAPYDLFFYFHYHLVFWAFRTFLVAVSIYAYIIFRQKTYPRQYGWVFMAFSVLLTAYLVLLEFGPSAETPEGLIVQATGQKVIAYVSILSVMAQSWLAYRFRQNMEKLNRAGSAAHMLMRTIQSRRKHTP